MTKRHLIAREPKAQRDIDSHRRRLGRIDPQENRATSAVRVAPRQQPFEQTTPDTPVPPLGSGPHSPDVRYPIIRDRTCHTDKLSGRVHGDERGRTIANRGILAPTLPPDRRVGGFSCKRVSERHRIRFQGIELETAERLPLVSVKPTDDDSRRRVLVFTDRVARAVRHAPAGAQHGSKSSLPTPRTVGNPACSAFKSNVSIDAAPRLARRRAGRGETRIAAARERPATGKSSHWRDLN
jgi:hypothetical protein